MLHQTITLTAEKFSWLAPASIAAFGRRLMRPTRSAGPTAPSRPHQSAESRRRALEAAEAKRARRRERNLIVLRWNA